MRLPVWLNPGIVVLMLACAGLLSCLGCQRGPVAPPLVKLTGSTMGTFYEVTIHALPAGRTAEELQEAIEQRLEEVNREMSTYLPDSEISRFNQSTGDDWFPISPGFAEVVQASLEIARLTEGAFDPTVMPLVNLWKFGPEQQQAALPTDEEIAQAQERVGYTLLEFQAEPPALRKAKPELQLDLSGIAKGHGVDRVVRLLAEWQLEDCLVNIGGEIVARGTRPDGEPWRLAIEKPVEGRREIQSVVLLRDQSLATSGDYRNFYEVDGQRYSHTIDPQTGRPVQHSLHSVSVLAENCMLADAWATALLVAGPARAWEWAEQQGLEVLLIFSQDGTLKTRQSADFPVQSIDQ